MSTRVGLPGHFRIISSRLPEIDRPQRLARIEADGPANPYIVDNVETAFAALELEDLRLIGSERAG